MDASQERVFHYHASSNALGGVLTHPYKTVISTAANSALANAGGYNSSPTVPYHLDHVLHCERAYTHVTGGDEDGHRLAMLGPPPVGAVRGPEVGRLLAALEEASFAGEIHDRADALSLARELHERDG